MFVYLLVSNDKASFKIGKANDVWARMDAVGGKAAFDHAASKVCKLHSERRSLHVEKSLHRLFDKWRLPHEDIRCDGDTEYFSMECHEQVLNLVKTAPDLFGELRPLPEHPATPPVAVRPCSHKEKQAIWETRREKRREKETQNALTKISQWIEARKRSSLFFGFCPPSWVLLKEHDSGISDPASDDPYLFPLMIPSSGGVSNFLQGASFVYDEERATRYIRVLICGLWEKGVPIEVEGPLMDIPKFARGLQPILAGIPGFALPGGLPGAREMLEMFKDQDAAVARLHDAGFYDDMPLSLWPTTVWGEMPAIYWIKAEAASAAMGF